jgi:RNA polymerase sigma-70 factor (ECF subfamily)
MLADEVRQLVNRCMAGEQSAMVELVDRYRAQILGLCYRMLGQRQDAEDMAQETFVRALRNLSQWDQRRDFEPWLLAIAGNRCRTALAMRMRRPKMQTLVEPLPDESPDVHAAHHLAEEVNLALSKLRDEYRQAFVMFHDHELCYAEIAAVLRCPLGTVKTWVHQARRELIEHLRQREIVQESPHALRAV